MTAPNGTRVLFLDRDVAVPEEALLSGLSFASQRTLRTISHPARRAEFLRSRYLVRQVLGVSDDPVRDADGLIVWPPGTCGSVSHSLGQVSVALSGNEDVVSVGLDIEHSSRVKPALIDKICTAVESAMVTAGKLSLVDVFVAKEALFKCHFPAGRRRFWFQDAEVVSVDGERRLLDLRVLMDTSPLTPAGSITRVQMIDPPLAECAGALAVLRPVQPFR
ncbi:MAG: hypothetical protein RIQ81_702 [Pseudomonadota bacterium]|jgi:enterobactin synthetase component D